MDQRRLGMGLAIVTYILWGILPLYWKLLQAVDPFVVLAHRIIWSAVFLQLVFLFHNRGRPRRLNPLRHLRSPALFRTISAGAVLISLNWGIYIWAVGQGRVTECSLGYFMAPLGYALIGIVLFKDRLTLIRVLSIGLAILAIGLRIDLDGRVEPVSLTLMSTICVYGVVKKGSRLSSLESVFLETAVMFPIAAGYLFYQWYCAASSAGRDVFGPGPGIFGLLMLAGPITAIPLLCYGESIKRITLTTQGVIQYLSPSLQFLLAIFVFHEAWTEKKLIVFILIWISIGLYIADAVLRRNNGDGISPGIKNPEGKKSEDQVPENFGLTLEHPFKAGLHHKHAEDY